MATIGGANQDVRGDRDHVGELLGDRVTDLPFEHRAVRVTHFAEPADFDALAERFDVGGIGHLVIEWEYLLVTCRRA